MPEDRKRPAAGNGSPDEETAQTPINNDLPGAATPASAISWSVESDEVVESTGETTLRGYMALYRLVRRAVTRKSWMFWIAVAAVFVGYQVLFVSIVDGLLWLLVVLLMRFLWLYFNGDLLRVFSMPVDRVRFSREGFIVEGKDFRLSMGWKRCWIVEGQKGFVVTGKLGQSLFLTKDTLAAGAENTVRDFATRNGLREKTHSAYTVWNMDGLSQETPGTRPTLRPEGIGAARCRKKIIHFKGNWWKVAEHALLFALIWLVVVVKRLVPAEEFVHWARSPGELELLILLTFLAFIVFFLYSLAMTALNLVWIRRTKVPGKFAVVPGTPPALQLDRETVLWEFSLRRASAWRLDKSSFLFVFDDGKRWIRFFFDEGPGTGKRGEVEEVLRQYLGPPEN